MKKLVIVFGIYPDLFYRVGGLQVQVRETYKALKELGHTVMYTHEWLENPVDVDIYHQFGNELSQLKLFKENKKIATKTIISPIYQNSGSSMKRKVIKFINTLSSFDFLNYKRKKALLKSVDGFIFLGEDERKNLEAFFEIKTKDYAYIMNGVKVNYPEKIVKSDYIVNIGSVNQRKNQELLIRVAKELGIPLKIIGPLNDQEYYQKCVKAAENANVEFLGSLNNLSSEFSNTVSGARMMILPSLSEVLPISVFESLCLGTPVLCTNNCSIDQYIQKDYLRSFDPTNEDQLMSLIRDFQEQKVEVPEEDALELIEKLKWVNIAKEITNFYGKILQEDE
jgi:glycosyltransferase involved in cell wall biosynthesis